MAINTKNLANAIVASNVGTSSTTMSLQAGYGASMPAVPFFLTCTPPGQLSTMGNSEVVLVTAITSDSLTIERAKKSTTAKDIKAGWVVSNSVYVETSTQIGDIITTLNATPRAGRLFMDGGTYNKSDYPLMYQYVVDNANYGTTTSTTFTLRDMRGRVPVGLDSAQTEFNALSKSGGEKQHKLTLSELPSHSHGLLGQAGSAGSAVNWTGSFGFLRANTGSYTTWDERSDNGNGGNQPHNVLQPYIVVNYEVIAE